MVTTHSNEKEKILFGQDNIICPKFISGIVGGRTLDVTGITATTISAGHVIITDGNGKYKPMPVASSGTAYDSLPSSWSYAGILYRSVLTKRPSASIMTNGQVNTEAAPYALPSGFAAACPFIQTVKDEEA